MSDHSNSTGSSGSSTNSWTLLSPEEGEMENLGPADDGTESLGDVPSLSEEVAGATCGSNPEEPQAETVLSEEGQRVCQETSPEDSEGPIAAGSSPPPPPHFTPSPELDADSQAPVIHDIVTSSPSDNHEHLGSTPFVTNIALGAPLAVHGAEPPPPSELESESETELEPESDPSPPVPVWPALDKPTDPETVPGSSVSEAPVVRDAPVATETLVSTETLVVTGTTPGVMKDPVLGDDPVPVVVPQESISPETIRPSDLPSHAASEDEPNVDHPILEAPAEGFPETVGPTEPAGPEPNVDEEVEEEEDEETQLLENEFLEEAVEALGSEMRRGSFDVARGDTSSEDEGGPRRRHRQRRTSDEDEEDEDVEFRMAEKAEEKRGFPVNKCIVGALVLLCLGSLFLSDDSDSPELSGAEQTENWPGDDSQALKEMLDKLAQENQKISRLEAKLQSQKEELDLALAAAAVKGDEKGTENLERDNARMKHELSALPALKEELQMLRARVTELSQLTANQEIATTTQTPPGGRPENVQLKAAEVQQRSDPKQGDRLKDQLQRQRLLLDESKKRLEVMKTEGGDRAGVRDDVENIQRSLSEHVETLGRRRPWEEKRGKGDQKKKNEKKDHRRGKDEDGGEARKEGRERKQQHKHNSHKEAWRKHQGEWDRKKAERRMDREERRKEAPGGDRDGGKPHRQPGHQPQRRQYDHESFWRHQGDKLRRKLGPPAGCGNAESCAAGEALFPVELPEFEELLEGYLSKLEGSPAGSREALRRLTAEFFRDGVFVHDRIPFAEFAEDVADVLEDVADLLEGGDALEEEMEEFEREALWKFSATA